MLLPELQQDRLTRRAETAGRFAGLVYYHAVRRDLGAIQALQARLTHPEDALAAQLVSGEPPDPAACVAAMDHVRCPWVCYTAVKCLLRGGHVGPALNTVTRYMAAVGVRACDGLNLVGRYLLADGAGTSAARVFERSLALAPKQRDVVTLLEAMRRGDDAGWPLHLDPLPLAASTGYYVPVYNVERYIRQAIEGLLAQNQPLAEIVVVNDGTEDRAMDIVAEYAVTLVEHETNQGVGAARSSAFRAATSEYFGCIDTDAAPEAGCIQYLMMAFEAGPPELAGLGGRVVERHTDRAADYWRSIHMPLDRGQARYYMDPPPAALDTLPEDVQAYYTSGRHFLIGANVLFRRQAVLEVGAYNAAYRNAQEDVDICDDLIAHGFHYAFQPHAVAWHLREDTPRSVLRRAWSYAYWPRKKLGYYTNLTAYAGGLLNTCVIAHAKIEYDVAGRRDRCLYLDLLFFYHSMCLDLDYMVREGLAPAGQAATIAAETLNTLKPLDQRFGGALYERVHRDVAYLLPAAAPEPVPEGLDTVYAEILAGVAGFIGKYSAALYRCLLESARHVPETT